MSSNPALYRYIDFIGANILDASNVNLLETVLQNIANGGLGTMYEPGAILNGQFVISGSTITFTAFSGFYPIYVLVNGQWETLGSTVSISGVQPVSGAVNNLYLNWSQNIITSAQDSTFVDGTTGEPTIEAGQLSLQVSWTDTSGVSLNPSTQFAKNTTPIILAVFNMAGSSITVEYINGVYPYAIGNPNQAGLLQLTDTSGIAAGTNDPRLANSRSPLVGSVYNVSVAALISSGTNASTLANWAANTTYVVGNQVIDSNGNIENVTSISGTGTSGASAPSWSLTLGGQTIDNSGGNQIVWTNLGVAATTKYDPATAGQGGIFTDSIIYTSLKENLTTFLNSVNTAIQNAISELANHIGKPLGTAATHPFPTAAQVGAAPASHVGQALGLGTSHPALVNSDTSGFIVDEITTTNSGDAFGLYSSSSVRKASITHTGDVYSLLANSSNAQGDNGTGGAAVNRGTLGLMSFMAAALAEHVNYNTHGNNNPHNLNAADIGAASQSYVDSTVAAILAAAQGYTTARTNISVRKVTNTAPYNTNYGTQFAFDSTRTTGTPPQWDSGFGGIQLPTQSSMTYLIFTFGSTVGTNVLPMWQASNFYNLGFQIVDTNGNIQQITTVGSAGYGLSSASAPSWNATLHGTTSDGSSTTAITWTNEGPASTLKGFEIAFGSGQVVFQGAPLSSQTGSPHGDLVPIPEATPANNPSILWTYTNALAIAAGGTTLQHTDSDDIESIQVGVDPTTFQVYGFSRTSTHTPVDAGVANVMAIFYRQL